MIERLSDEAAVAYLDRYYMAIAVRARTGRTHLVEKGRSECGSPFSMRDVQQVWIAEEKNLRWCYSCIGNAIERMETE